MRTRTDSFSETRIVRTRGKLLARALGALFAAALLAQLFHAAIARDGVEAEAPDFALEALDGRNHRLSEYRSEVVALAFWASWCGPCREQLPELERMQQARGADGLRVLSVNFDADAPATRDAAAGLSFPVLADPGGEAGRLYDVDDLPLVVLVDREGRVRGRYEGSRAARGDELDRQLRALLAE